MKIVALLLILLPSLAFARIGDSREQSRDRYGVPYESEAETSLFRSSEYYFLCTYENNICVSEMVFREDKNEISEIALKAILAANAGASSWGDESLVTLLKGRAIIRADKKVEAIYVRKHIVLNVISYREKRQSDQAEEQIKKAKETF